ncbi:MAG: hypothetical protein ACRDKB_05325 [Actinomycetota bacterium]
MSLRTVNRRRLLQTTILLAGLLGLAVAVARAVDDTHDQVMPSPGALAVAAVFGLIAILTSGRAWVVLFADVLESGAERLQLEGAYYVSQLTKYLPGGGVVQAASQVGLAASLGVPLGRVALAFPVSAVGSVAAGTTLGAGLVLSGVLPGWARALALLGLAAPVFLHRRLMTGVLRLARRAVGRIPAPNRLPSQRSILVYYGWAIASISASAAAYTVLLRSLTGEANPAVVFSASALSWAVGFLVVPIPSGIGIREAVLIAMIPGVGTVSLLAASLAQRLLAIGADVAAVVTNRLLRRLQKPAEPQE